MFLKRFKRKLYRYICWLIVEVCELMFYVKNSKNRITLNFYQVNSISN